MAKSEFLMLAHKYDPKKHFVGNYFLSTKLDGIRALWDGGISKGIPAREVPWANIAKDARLREEVICTGLWSRYGHVIHCPEWWSSKLPQIFLDGELYIKPNSWQELSSIVKRYDKNLTWNKVKYIILDSPPPQIIFEDKIINNTNYKKTFSGIIQWIKNKGGENLFIKPQPFLFTYEKLQNSIQNEYYMVHEQHNIPLHNSQFYIEEQLEKVVEEGLVIRNPMAIYICERTHNLLKYKPYEDDEGIVTGYIWGEETELGSKLLGMMGSLIVNYKGHEFALSGFKDIERKMIFLDHRKGMPANDEGICCHKEKVNSYIGNPMFPRGSTITFRYRELSDKGVPKEARYLRKYKGI